MQAIPGMHAVPPGPGVKATVTFVFWGAVDEAEPAVVETNNMARASIAVFKANSPLVLTAFCVTLIRLRPVREEIEFLAVF